MQAGPESEAVTEDGGKGQPEGGLRLPWGFPTTRFGAAPSSCGGWQGGLGYHAVRKHNTSTANADTNDVDIALGGAGAPCQMEVSMTVC